MHEILEARLREKATEVEATIESMLQAKAHWSRERLIYRILLLLLAAAVVVSATR